MRYFCISGFIMSQNTKTSDNRLIERLLAFGPTFPTKLGKTERANVDVRICAQYEKINEKIFFAKTIDRKAIK